MMRKILAICLAAALMLGLLCSCSSSGSGKKKEIVDLSFQYEAAEAYSGSVKIDCTELGRAMLDSAKESYKTAQSGVEVTVETSGHDDSIERFVNKEIDVLILSADTSKEQDEAIVGAYGDGQAVQLRFATDGIAIIVNPANTQLDCITKEEIVSLFTAGGLCSDDAVTWSDLHGSDSDEQITVCGTGETDDLYCYFRKLVLQGKDVLTTYQPKDSIEAVLDTVASDPNAIAFVSLSAYLRNADRVKALPVDFGRGPTEPTKENILGTGSIMGPYSEFTYPLFLYVGRANAKENAQVFDFVRYLLSDQGAAKLAEELHYIPLSESDYVNQIGTLAN